MTSSSSWCKGFWAGTRGQSLKLLVICGLLMGEAFAAESSSTWQTKEPPVAMAGAPSGNTQNRYLEKKGPSGWRARGCASKAWGGWRPQDRTGGAWGQADPGGPVFTPGCVHFRCLSSCQSLLQLLTVSYLDVATILVPPCVVWVVSKLIKNPSSEVTVSWVHVPSP